MPEVFLFSLLSKITELLCGFAPFGKIFGEFYTIQIKFTYFFLSKRCGSGPHHL